MKKIEKYHYPNIVWSLRGSEVLEETNAWLLKQHEANPTAADAAWRELMGRLAFLNDYGGPVNNGELLRWPDRPAGAVVSEADAAFDEAMKAEYARHNEGPTDLRRWYQVTLGADGAPFSWSITWRTLNPVTGEYAYAFNGGLICHCSGAQTFAVELHGSYWSIHT